MSDEVILFTGLNNELDFEIINGLIHSITLLNPGFILKVNNGSNVEKLREGGFNVKEVDFATLISDLDKDKTKWSIFVEGFEKSTTLAELQSIFNNTRNSESLSIVKDDGTIRDGSNDFYLFLNTINLAPYIGKSEFINFFSLHSELNYNRSLDYKELLNELEFMITYYPYETGVKTGAALIEIKDSNYLNSPRNIKLSRITNCINFIVSSSIKKEDLNTIDINYLLIKLMILIEENKSDFKESNSFNELLKMSFKLLELFKELELNVHFISKSTFDECLALFEVIINKCRDELQIEVN